MILKLDMLSLNIKLLMCIFIKVEAFLSMDYSQGYQYETEIIV